MNNIRDFVPIWKVERPTQRAPMPGWMSFHYLREAEACPRSVALKRAKYEQLWNGFGYPVKPTIAAFAGIAVHSAAELIIREFLNDGVPSPREPKAMETLRKLGGYSTILSTVIEKMLSREAENPRFQEVAVAFQKLIVAKIPRMREMLQELLGGQSWTLGTVSEGSGPGKALTLKPDRRPLQFGTHFEIELQDQTIGWKGRVDIITVSDTNCVLVDLKTGTPSEDHIEQLRVYSVLWDGDRDLNPKRLPISGMSLCYGARSVALSTPTEDDIVGLRSELKRRTLRVKTELEQENVVAKPSTDNCRFCQVKLICDEYWKSPSSIEAAEFRDLEIELKAPRGDGDVAWNAQIVSSNSKPIEDIVLKRSSNDSAFWTSLKPNTRVRLTDAHYTAREGDLALVSLTTFGEVLLLEK